MTTKTSHKTPSRVARRKAHAPPPVHPGPAHPRSVPIEVPELESGSEPDTPFAEGVHDGIDADLRHRLVSEAAYNLYQERGFTDGYDLDDWLQAEAAVDHLLLNPKGRAEVPAEE